MVINQTASESPELTIQSQLRDVFERDWSSAYSTPLTQHTSLRDVC